MRVAKCKLAAATVWRIPTRSFPVNCSHVGFVCGIQGLGLLVLSGVLSPKPGISTAIGEVPDNSVPLSCVTSNQCQGSQATNTDISVLSFLALSRPIVALSHPLRFPFCFFIFGEVIRSREEVWTHWRKTLGTTKSHLLDNCKPDKLTT